MDKDSEDIFNSFLKKVDTISDLVKDLSSSDVDAEQRAVTLQKADLYIATLEEGDPCRTRINRTVINTNTPQPPPALSGTSDSNASPETFMTLLEKDAEDRTRRRKVKEEKAKALKEKGNEAYSQGDYQSAVKHYSAGLEELRDMQPLYTNRAQAYIKLGKYKQAIDDCQWALKCDARCVKAYVHMGKAQLALREYSQARSCYQKIVEIDPGKEALVKDYLLQVDQEEQTEAQECQAREEVERGEEEATRLVQLLDRLSRPGQTPAYYCGGLQLLSQAITDCSAQTLFRLHNGFSVIDASPAASSCLSESLSAPYSVELCVSVLRLWRVICIGNDVNQKMLLESPSSCQSIVGLLASESAEVSGECLALLCLFSATPRGRRLAVDNLDLHMLVPNLTAHLSKQNQQEPAALTVLQNLAEENRFCTQLRGTFTTSVEAPFTSMLRNITSSNRHLLPSLLSTIGALTRDSVIREGLSGSAECWEALLVAMERCRSCEYRDVLYPLLGLVINLSSRTSPTIQERAVPLSACCLGLLSDTDGGVITRATGVLSTVLPQSAAATERAVQAGVVRTMTRLLKSSGQTTTRYAIKTLAVCTAASHTARQELAQGDMRLSTLRRLLSSRFEEAVLGNAALCLGHCLEVEGASAGLLGTDVVATLLRLAGGDAAGTAGTALQRNAAIALGRLCRAEPRHMAKLRKLHGLEILHSCMKLIT